MRPFLLCVLVLLGACSHHSDFYLWDAGYTISHRAEGFAFEMHRNQLKQLGGEINSPRFRHFVFDRLTRHEGCEGGWQLLPCVADRSCVLETKVSVTVLARCTQNAVRGRLLYEAHCQGCHYERVHDRLRPAVKDLSELRDMVAQWAPHTKRGYSPDELESIVEHLNGSHYRFGLAPLTRQRKELYP